MSALFPGNNASHDSAGAVLIIVSALACAATAGCGPFVAGTYFALSGGS